MVAPLLVGGLNATDSDRSPGVIPVMVGAFGGIAYLTITTPEPPSPEP